jgi:hypothetical protein
MNHTRKNTRLSATLQYRVLSEQGGKGATPATPELLHKT